MLASTLAHLERLLIAGCPPQRLLSLVKCLAIASEREEGAGEQHRSASLRIERGGGSQRHDRIAGPFKPQQALPEQFQRLEVWPLGDARPKSLDGLLKRSSL